MQNRTPVAREARPALPDFAPVPRKYRHDGWTPERQRAFIEALADTGSVTRAAGMVNIAQRNAYALRRAPGAEEFRRAWDAALDFGVARLKDIAFERAVEGELIPVFQAGKLMGYRRKRNDALLMFCLRHYGPGAEGRRTTVNYFSSKATAGVGAGAVATASAGTGGAVAEAAACATTMRVTRGERPSAETLALADDAHAAALARFEGVTLDEEAGAAIARALEDCAARARAAEAQVAIGGAAEAEALADDPAADFVRTDEEVVLGNLSLDGAPEHQEEDEDARFAPGEPRWALAGADKPDWLVAMEDRAAAGLPAVAPLSEEELVRVAAETRADAQETGPDSFTRALLANGGRSRLNGEFLGKDAHEAQVAADRAARVTAAGDAAVAAWRAARSDDGVAAVKRPTRRRRAREG